MGARVIRKKLPNANALDERRQIRALAMIMGAVVLPLTLAYVLAAMDMRIDLSDLNTWRGAAGDGLGVDGLTLVGWPDLDPLRELPGVRSRMIGYMMDGYETSRDGTAVSMFILMPEAGHFLHPAHREPNQMVEVRLRRAVPFKYRELVWASGMLERTANEWSASGPYQERALYAMRDAEVDRAEDREIGRWFRVRGMD